RGDARARQARALQRTRVPLGADLGRRAGPGGGDPLEPGCRAESPEDLGRLGEEAVRVVAPSLRDQPLAVLEPDDREVERKVELAELGGSRREQPVGGWIGAGKTGAEAVGLCFEKRRPQADRLLLDDGEQLLRLRPLAERQRSLECVEECELRV